MAAVYRFADRDIAISTGHEEIHELCRDYAADASPLFAVETNRADIKFERVRSERRDIAEGHTVHAYTNACPETPAVLRKIAERMPEYDTFLFHGSAIAADGASGKKFPDIMTHISDSFSAF